MKSRDLRRSRSRIASVASDRGLASPWGVCMRWLRLSVIVVVLALTAGCAPMSRIELAQDGIVGLHSIDVVMPPEPQEYVVFMENHPGAAVGGVIGGVIMAADQTAKTNRVRQALQGQHISVSRTIADALIQRFRATG